MKMICLECGYSFNYDENKECPICKSKDEDKMLRSIDFSDFHMHKIGICNQDELKMQVKELLEKQNHSVAYMKVCGYELERLGYMDLSMSINEIAKRKANMEALVLEAYGIKDEIRVNLNNIIVKATEDVKLANLIAKHAKEKNNDALHDLMHEMAKNEATNLAVLNGILKKYLVEIKKEF